MKPPPPPVSSREAPKILDARDRQAYVQLGLLATFFSCVLFGLFRLASELSGAGATPWWANALGAIAAAVAWGWYRQDPLRRSSAGAHAAGAIALFVLVAPAFYGMSSTLWWLSLIAFAMTLMGTRREAWLWAGGVLIVVVLLTLFEPYVQIVGAATEQPLEHGASRVAFLLVLLAVAFGFRRVIERRARETAEAREQAERSNRAKSRFLAHMSHELRTPLNGVIAMTDLVLHSDVDSETRANVQTAHRSAELLLRLIQDVLDTSRLESDGVTLERKEFRLHEVLCDVLVPLADRAGKAGQVLTAVAAPDLPERRLGDPVRVSQIALNLVSNALKFSPGGRISVRLEAGEGEHEVRLTVEDTGCGIPQDRLDDVFQPFVQVTDSAEQRNAGTGLGLAITRELARLMGGEVVVSSVLGEGCAFVVTLELPCAPGALTSAGPTDLLDPGEAERPRVPASTTASSGLRILVVDDDPVNRMIAHKLLEALGHSSELAEHGGVAFARLEQEPFDLLLADLEMPELDGLELARRIRKREVDEDRARLPIVALTAHTDAEWRERAIRAGMDGYLAKPFRIRDLAKTLDDVLRAS